MTAVQMIDAQWDARHELGVGRRAVQLPRLWTFVLLATIICLVPLLVTTIPSMTDLQGHIGRFHVMMAINHSSWLTEYYTFDWHLEGNLGIDLVVWTLSPLFGVERAALIAVAAIIPLTILGLVAINRAAFGRIEPTTLLAASFILSNPFLFGFVNYCLSLTLALLAFAAWIVLRDKRVWLQIVVMAPLIFITWIAHTMGLGILALLIGGFELERLWRLRSVWRHALCDSVLRAVAFMPTILVIFLWQQPTEEPLFVYGDDLLTRKILNWVVMLRGGDRWTDLATPLVIAGTMLLLWRKRFLRLDPRLATSCVLMASATIALPTTIMSSWGADERLVPAAVMIGILSFRWQGTRKGAGYLALFAIALLGVRTCVIASQWRTLDRDYNAALAGLDVVPQGATVHTTVLMTCKDAWQKTAWGHLSGLAMVRRDALVNSQWPMPGGALLHVKPRVNPAPLLNPSEQLIATDCDGKFIPDAVSGRLNAIPKGWQFAWVLNAKGHRNLWPGHQPIYQTKDSALYRLD